MATKSIELSIPKPCHEKWDQMDHTEKGAFCKVCTKEVMDFTHKSDREIMEYFEKVQDKTCGRFRDDQLQQQITEYTQTTTHSGWKVFLLSIISLPGIRTEASDTAVRKDSSSATIAQNRKPSATSTLTGEAAPICVKMGDTIVNPAPKDTIVHHKISVHPIMGKVMIK
jgi:hypothetical protein